VLQETGKELHHSQICSLAEFKRKAVLPSGSTAFE
jgi:hypothetical protein